MNTPTVTVGIPIYNAIPYLEMAIQSVVNQTFADWELILLDDGSTDDSLTIARRWESDRIRVVADGQNKGQTARLNELTQMTRGRYVARMDADDIMAPDRLRQQVAYLDTHPDVDLIGSFIYTIDTQNQVYGQRGTTQVPTTVADVLNGLPIAHPTVMGKRDWFMQNPYSLKIRRSQDLDLWLRTAPHSKFAVVDQPLLFYREIGLPYLKKYLASSVEFRHMLTDYVAELGPTAVRIAQARMHGKDLIYRLFSALGREDFLIKRRSQALPADEQQRAQALLEQSIWPAPGPLAGP